MRVWREVLHQADLPEVHHAHRGQGVRRLQDELDETQADCPRNEPPELSPLATTEQESGCGVTETAKEEP